MTFESRMELSRRSVLKALGAGMVVLAVGPVASAQRRGAEAPQTIDAWLHIGEDGQITVLTGKVEVGQNVRTSLAQAVAEELRVPIDSIRMVMGDTALVPYDMGTFGSLTTPTMAPQLRRAGAAAREALLDRAAEKWGVDRARLRTEDGRITDRPEHSATYGELVAGKPLDGAIRSDIALTAPQEHKVLGRSVPKVDGRAIVTGSHRYSADLVRPGMLHAVVLRAPSLGAMAASIDEAAAQALPGTHVVRDGEFVAVAAPTRRQAEAGLAALKAKWNEVPGPSASTLFEDFRKALGDPGSIAGAHVLRATYTAPYIAHVPLEPRAALAEWVDGKMTVHTGTQRPFGVRTEVAQALGINEDLVRVLVPDTGSGYGGKHTGDAAVEAARIANALGEPVKVAWTRPEEFRFAYLRPAALIEIAAGVDAHGMLTGWSFETVNPGGAGLRTPYRVSNPRERSTNGPSPLRQGSYRALGATVNHFARESHMDDLARLAGLDPVAFRLKNLTEDSIPTGPTPTTRLRAVLELCASEFGWSTPAPDGHGFGIACGAEKGGFIATAVEVAVDGKEFRVVRATSVFDCGAVVNPKHLESQILGALVQGLGGALFERIDYRNGKLLTDRLSRYRVPRFGDVPKIEVVLLDRKDLPSSGAGECPIVAIAPAIRNALLAATGQGLRDLPLRLV
ncbi:MAG: molybdopterin-dependent oxidoreductase [Fimbriimonadaceae bacterium]|nr:xanthine dehydrogenase family protein molybdopterin-binding subunit [Chthonomonadaceae bacterium]MCO5297232.1 molybdopterin-dependent oxidoreductase [Fimbriimonadaceae bacterium]